MVRASAFKSGKDELETGITTELDPEPGLYNIGNQWVASGILEWCRNIFYKDLSADVYEIMISGAEKVPKGSNGVKVLPNFYEELKGTGGGQISGLTLGTTRDEIYRATLEALCERLNRGKKALEKAGAFSAESILCVGGGSKNRLWNRMRAEYTGIPLKVINRTETTVLGASMFVQAAVGNAASAAEARKQVDYRTEIIEP
jgi:L-fuculokinase